MDPPAAKDYMGLPAVFVKECLADPEAGIEWQVDSFVVERYVKTCTDEGVLH